MSVGGPEKWYHLYGVASQENRPNNKHHKMYRQFSKPAGQLPGKFSREYPRAASMEGDDRRYRGLEIPMGDSLFAAYDPLDIKNAKYLKVASSDYLYTPRSLLWPDVIFLTAPTLDWRQAISVQRIVSMGPQVVLKRAARSPHRRISSQQRGHGRSNCDAPFGHG